MLGWNAELLVLHPFLDDHSGRFRFGCHSRSFFRMPARVGKGVEQRLVRG